MATYALERVGSETMMGNYVDKDIIQNNPFDVISYDGMKDFLTHSINQAKSANKDIIIGVCSEQVRDENSLKFFSTLPIDYVSSTGQSIPFMKYTLARNEIND
jgi:pyruvate,orthophosphate dikinase